MLRVWVCECALVLLLLIIILQYNTLNNNSNTFIQHGLPGPDGASVLDFVMEAPDSGPVTV